MVNQKIKIKLVLLLITILITAIFIGCTIGGTTFESRSDSKRRQERLVFLLEEKYDVNFEVVSSRASGRLGSTNSYNVVSDKYPDIKISASLYDEYSENEEMIESYGMKILYAQSNEFLVDYINQTSENKILMCSGDIMLKNYNVYTQDKYDLDYYSFTNILENNSELLGDSTISLIHFARVDEEEYELLNEVLFEYFQLVKSWGGDKIITTIRVYNVRALESELYKKYIHDSEYSIDNFIVDISSNDHFLRGTGGSLKINLNEIENIEDINDVLLFKVDEREEKN